jgi:uncharacterized membrane protein (DUF373 family)
MENQPGQESDVALETVAKRLSSARRFETYRSAASGTLKKTRDAWPLLTAYERFEQVVSLVLTALVSVLVLATLVHLTYRILRLILFDLADPTQQEFFQTVFGMVMTVLIALEFNHSIVSVLERRHGIVQVRTVVLVALLALVRKFILIDVTQETPVAMLGLAASVLALGAVYWLVREQDQREADTDTHGSDGGMP